MASPPALYRLTSMMSDCETGAEVNVVMMVAVTADSITLTTRPLDAAGPIQVITIQSRTSAPLLQHLMRSLVLRH